MLPSGKSHELLRRSVSPCLYKAADLSSTETSTCHVAGRPYAHQAFRSMTVRDEARSIARYEALAQAVAVAWCIGSQCVTSLLLCLLNNYPSSCMHNWHQRSHLWVATQRQSPHCTTVGRGGNWCCVATHRCDLWCQLCMQRDR